MSLSISYNDTIEYLYALQKHGIKLALANSIKLMEVMGNPQNRFRSIHVAGTNGKGSTSAFIANMLQAAGYRVGLYTSPHLVSFTERMRINTVPIAEARVVALVRRVRERYRGVQASDGSGEMSPTFFEVTTAVAFSYFAEENVDLAVIEVGMGGRLDATNVISPLVSVITNIDLEHMEFLGSTLEQIAGEKAGIIKAHVPLVTGVTQQEVIDVIEREASGKGAPLLRLTKDFSPEEIMTGPEIVFDFRGWKTVYRGLHVGMLGRHQVDNASLAVAAVELLRDAGISIDEPSLRRGLAQTRWEGRLERVAVRPDLFLDGAHNPASARTLGITVADLKRSYRKLILVIGILGDKDYRGILAALVPLADLVVVTKPEYSRALDVDTLAMEIRKMHGAVHTAGTVGSALALARSRADADDLILVTGSLYVVGDARAVLCAHTGQADMLSGLKG
jgi:dihydrofolate synthase/folylpolyglutamate synthase